MQDNEFLSDVSSFGGVEIEKNYYRERTEGGWRRGGWGMG